MRLFFSQHAKTQNNVPVQTVAFIAGNSLYLRAENFDNRTMQIPTLPLDNK